MNQRLTFSTTLELYVTPLRFTRVGINFQDESKEPTGNTGVLDRRVDIDVKERTWASLMSEEQFQAAYICQFRI